MDSKLDKHEFCQRYMENRDGMAMRIAYEETLKAVSYTHLVITVE